MSHTKSKASPTEVVAVAEVAATATVPVPQQSSLSLPSQDQQTEVPEISSRLRGFRVLVFDYQAHVNNRKAKRNRYIVRYDDVPRLLATEPSLVTGTIVRRVVSENRQLFEIQLEKPGLPMTGLYDDAEVYLLLLMLFRGHHNGCTVV